MATIPTFDLFVTEATDGYTAQAAFGGGELPAQPFVLPLDLSAVSDRRGDIAEWVEQARIIRRSAVGEQVQQARILGTALFEQLFVGELLASFREARKALPIGQYLRVRLRLPASLATLPWELLFDPRDEQFLALAPDLVLVRYPELPAPVTALHLDGPLRVVFVAASPRDLPPLDIDQELHRVTAALKGPMARNQIMLDVVRGPDTLGQLRTRLREPAHVVHFLGHGEIDSTSGEGMLLFEDPDGAAEAVNAELLRVQLQRQRGQTQLVVLNACLGALPAGNDPFSSVGAALLRASVPAVIAMQFAIPDDVAIDLARVFYGELAAGTPVDLAVNETRMQLYGRNPFALDWVIPVLFLRAVDGVLFELPAAPPANIDMRPPDPATATQPPLPVAPAPRPMAPVPQVADQGAAAERSAPRRRRTWKWLGIALVPLFLCSLALVARSMFLPKDAPSSTTLPDAAAPTESTAGGATTPQPVTAASTVESSSPGSVAAPPPTVVAALPAPKFPKPIPTLPPLAAINVSNTPGRSEQVQIAVDAAGAVHLVWLDNTPRQGSGTTVLYRKLAPDGTWSAVEDLTPDLTYVGKPFLVTSLDGDVCMVIDSVVGTFSRCLENGGWSPLANPLAAKIRNVFAPALGKDGQLRWLSGLNDVQYAGTKLDDGLVGSCCASFAIDANETLHAVWGRFGNPYSVEYRNSTDMGAAWTPQQRLTTPDAKFAEHPTLVADSIGAVHLAWAESGKKVYRRWTLDAGWSVPVDFGNGGGIAIALALDPEGHAAAVWAGDCEVRYARQEADGVWSQVRVLNASASPAACATEAELAIDKDGGQHVTWVAPGADGERDVFYALLSE